MRRQVRSLLDRGKRAVTFSDALTQPPSASVFAVTFDDAYRSVVTLGRPVLEELGVPGTVFVPTSADQDGIRHWEGIKEWGDTKWRTELEGACWEELSGLAATGWEIGSHTRTHPNLTTLDDDELHAELEGSRLDCESRLGTPCRSLAYPYGHVDSRVASAAERAGYAAAAALDVSDLAASANGVYSWPRLSVYRGDTPLRFGIKRTAYTHASRAFGWVQALRR